jgi:hypothetical protein
MSNVGTSLADVSAHLPHDANVLVAIQEGILFILGATTTPSPRVRGPIRLEACIGENNDESLSVFVGGGNGNVLLSNELRQGWRR